MYEAVKEITNDLIKKKYIKNQVLPEKEKHLIFCAV